MAVKLLSYSSLPAERIGGWGHLVGASFDRSLPFYQGMLGFQLLHVSLDLRVKPED